MTPGRGCPLPYRYSPSDLAREPELAGETLYVTGGLYGNFAVLKRIPADEPRPPFRVFNEPDA